MPSPALQALRRTVTVDWQQRADADARALLVRTAKAGHARILREQSARAGIFPEWTAYGDQPGVPVEQARQLIVYRYTYLREIVLVALRALFAASPVDSGAYRNAHTLYIDGAPASPNTPAKPGQEIMIANPLPYARRLEIGKTESGRDFLVSVPNRIYERVAKRVLIPRYRNAAQIRFGYVTVPGAHVIRGGLGTSYAIGGGRRRRRRQRRGASVQQPAIFIGALR